MNNKMYASVKKLALKLPNLFTDESSNEILALLKFRSVIFGTKYSRIDQVKSYLPQILLGPFLNTLSHLNAIFFGILT